MTVRVVIADDQQLVRAGFAMILSTYNDIEVVAEATNGNEAVALTASLAPDVVLMDIQMPGINGIEATRRIIRDTHARVLILTTFDLDEYVYEALRAGAAGFLLKDTPPEQLAAAVRTAHRGDALLAPSVTRRLIEEFTQPRQPSPPATPQLDQFDQLSPREAEVFRLLARGLTNHEIAAQLVVGENTVKTHVARILTKLDLRDRVQAVVLAYETGIVIPAASDPNQPHQE
jgi:DNA-binding NarL/FixJ family response regulator